MRPRDPKTDELVVMAALARVTGLTEAEIYALRDSIPDPVAAMAHLKDLPRARGYELTFVPGGFMGQAAVVFPGKS